MNDRPSFLPWVCGAFNAGFLAACGVPDGGGGSPTALPVLRLSAEPTLEIGVMGGDGHYTFQDVAAVLPRADGNLAVADAGGATISVFPAYGFSVPPGWNPGEVLCSPPATASGAEG